MNEPKNEEYPDIEQYYIMPFIEAQEISKEAKENKIRPGQLIARKHNDLKLVEETLQCKDQLIEAARESIDERIRKEKKRDWIYNEKFGIELTHDETKLNEMIKEIEEKKGIKYE